MTAQETLLAPGTDPELERRRLREKLASVRRRILVGRLVRATVANVTVFLVVLAALLAAEKLFSFGAEPWLLVAGCAGLSVVFSVAWTLGRGRVDLDDAARAVDQKLHLKERVSTAVYLDTRAGTVEGLSDWNELIRKDGLRHLESVSVREHFPVRPPRSTWWLPVAGALPVLVFLLVPTVDLLGYGEEREKRAREAELIAEREKELDRDLAAIQKKARDEELGELDELMGKVRQAASIEKASEPAKTPPAEAGDARKEALVNLSKRAETIKRSFSAERFDKLRKTLESYQKSSLRKFELSRPLRDALKKGDMKKALRELKSLQRSLRELSKTPRDELSAEDRAKLDRLSRELSSLASDSKLLSKLSAALRDAARGLDSKNLQGALDSLDLSAEELERLARQLQEMDLMRQALGLVDQAKQDLSDLSRLAQGKPHKCPNCGKPKRPPNPWEKPGGT